MTEVDGLWGDRRGSPEGEKEKEGDMKRSRGPGGKTSRMVLKGLAQMKNISKYRWEVA